MKILLAIALMLLVVSAQAVDFDSNVPKIIQEQMLQDLKFMGSVEGSGQTDLHRQIFNEVNGESYSRFFEDRILSVGKSGCGSPIAVACVYLSIKKKMFVTDNYIKFEHPQIARLMIIYHEARHTERENDNWTHATCPVPFIGEDGQEIKSIWTGARLAGEEACDNSPFGSYGSSTIMLKNISMFCENCNEKVKMDADIYAQDQLKRITNQKAKEDMKKDFGQALL